MISRFLSRTPKSDSRVPFHEICEMFSLVSGAFMDYSIWNSNLALVIGPIQNPLKALTAALHFDRKAS